jgi:hypothetical protein
MTIYHDHPVAGPILEGRPVNNVQTMKYDKDGKPDVYNLMVKAGYEGSPTRCGKDKCKNHPHFFVCDLYVGMPRFLCVEHTRRWVQKRRELMEKDKGFIYVFAVMRDIRGDIDVYLHNMENEIILRGAAFNTSYIKKKGKNEFKMPSDLPPLFSCVDLPPPQVAPVGPTGCCTN